MGLREEGFTGTDPTEMVGIGPSGVRIESSSQSLQEGERGGKEKKLK